LTSLGRPGHLTAEITIGAVTGKPMDDGIKGALKL
jgi:hypothetical protein